MSGQEIALCMRVARLINYKWTCFHVALNKAKMSVLVSYDCRQQVQYSFQ
jgi:hypothetical protein